MQNHATVNVMVGAANCTKTTLCLMDSKNSMATKTISVKIATQTSVWFSGGSQARRQADTGALLRDSRQNEQTQAFIGQEHSADSRHSQSELGV